MPQSLATEADRPIERDLLAAQSEIIELIAAGAPLSDTLDRITVQVERLAAPAMCSILLLEADRTRMRLASAPSLPAAYNQAIDGQQIGPAAGSCGTAMYRRAAVIVRDIASDPLWADYRDLALGHGLRACWSQPIIDNSGAVLGAFALYHRVPREPVRAEWRIVETMSSLVRVALIPHRREDALREQLHFMQQLLDAIPSPIFYKDTKGAYLGGNAAFERTLGMRAADFIGRTVHEVAPKEFAGTYHAADQALFRHPGVQVYEAQLPYPDGTSRDMLFHKATFLRPDNSIGGLVGVLIDITERKRVEGEMRRLASIVQLTDDAIISVTREGIVASWNRGAEKLFGYPAEEMLGKPGQAIVPPERLEEAARQFDRILDGGGSERFETERLRKDGARVLVALTLSPVTDANGAIIGIATIARDITARVRADHALRLAKEEAEMASRAKSQFLANMSHELRTPLNAVLGFSEVIRDGLMGEDMPRYREYAADIHRAGEHLLNLINDVLDLSKVEVGRLILNDDLVEVADLVESCVRLLEVRAREGGVEIERRVRSGLPLIRGDALRLKQILLNILSNAVKFTPAKGRVEVSAEVTAAGDMLLAVADTGIGMAARDIPVALAPFRQVEDALSRRFEGTGLGLPLAKSLTELHGGTLEIESEPGHGTTVRITLPAARLNANAPRG